MAGYWPSTLSQSIKVQKKEQGQSVSSHLDRISLVSEVFIIWPKDSTKKFCFWESKAGNPEKESVGPSCPLG